MGLGLLGDLVVCDHVLERQRRARSKLLTVEGGLETSHALVVVLLARSGGLRRGRLRVGVNAHLVEALSRALLGLLADVRVVEGSLEAAGNTVGVLSLCKTMSAHFVAAN